MSVIKNSNTEIIYAKFARFIICVDINGSEEYFRGTNISLNGGRFPFAQFITDNNITRYFVDRAESIYRFSLSKISEKEKEKIQDALVKNLNAFLQSDLGKAVNRDFTNKITPLAFKTKFDYCCDCCLNSMEEPDGYILRTYEVIQSKEYWRFVFSRNGFSISRDDLNKRVNYFKEIASSQTPWVICDNCISKFEIDISLSKSFMEEWIFQKGKFIPPKSDDFRKYISPKEFEEIGIKIVTVE